MGKMVIDEVVKVGHYEWWWWQVGCGDSSSEVMMGVDVISLPEMILLLNQEESSPWRNPITWDLEAESVKRFSSHHVWVGCIMTMSWVTEEEMRQKSST